MIAGLSILNVKPNVYGNAKGKPGIRNLEIFHFLQKTTIFTAINVL
jgi:hypothetical protein